jgi:hypothetical protein
MFTDENKQATETENDQMSATDERRERERRRSIRRAHRRLRISTPQGDRRATERREVP